ncbi:MAG: PIN domain-containing protein, partial [Candidatus Levybacteria bacterium]|nr:PIN domain-containing protein [Candidatus Levybacteria bacterium]
MKVIIDSSILIDYFRGGIKWQEFLEDVPKDVELFLPTIVIFELFSGKSTKKNGVAKDILNLLKQFIPIELTSGIAIKAGELYRDVGSRIDPADY